MTWPGSEYIDSIAADRAQMQRDAAQAPGLRQRNEALSGLLGRIVENWDQRRDRSRLDQPFRDLIAEARELLNGGR